MRLRKLPLSATVVIEDVAIAQTKLLRAVYLVNFSKKKVLQTG